MKTYNFLFDNEETGEQVIFETETLEHAKEMLIENFEEEAIGFIFLDILTDFEAEISGLDVY